MLGPAKREVDGVRSDLSHTSDRGPVVINTRVVNLVYARGANGHLLSDTTCNELSQLTEAMADAFTRLIRDKA